jgi:hypothetical protein
MRRPSRRRIGDINRVEPEARALILLGGRHDERISTAFALVPVRTAAGCE